MNNKNPSSDSIEWARSISGRSFFCSWSGGKDSCLSLYHAIRMGGRPQYLFTMLAGDTMLSRSHGLPRTLLERQASALGIPIVFNSATWSEYEEKFGQTLRERMANRVECGVFGDIDVESHREWCIKVCADKGIGVFHPLWKRPRRELLEEFIDLGFKAVIVVTRAGILGREWLGRPIDAHTVGELEKEGIDICGELGEYHTVVTGGPLFESELSLGKTEPILHNGYWYLTSVGMRRRGRPASAAPRRRGLH